MTHPNSLDHATTLLELDKQVCFGLVVAARGIVSLYKPILEPLGLTHPQYLVMLALWQHDRLSVKDLSSLLQLDPGTLSPLLKRLETAGLLRRARDQHDERLLAVSLTDAGTELRKQALQIPPAVMKQLEMTAEELEHLRDILNRVISATS
ncbi:MarR family transcriptional regulator [Nakamurella antarctica]|uniref:MarR family transcriptional regulator n=1 Tax=Nakamurella antarctica TaxID=1902245 RepID=A0A3G8ZHR0_9ACTN|nr:MarR family transcriptional regulator [Nakamurella antarctica]AZI56912.1 MarR family transcriptional regulator [Nakamurella antarctica]